ncbi:hypothetical protein KQI65_08325 [bacterium]|nr:hypothetical protein [bacterium]
MLHILTSTAARPSPGFKEAKRKRGENNLQWIQRNRTEGDGVPILLVGGRGPVSFRLRTAQAQLRHTLEPSHWSHCMLLDEAGKSIGATKVHEISLEPPGGFGFPPPTNGLQQGSLKQYASADAWPNIALLEIPVARREIRAAMKRYQMQRAVLDTVELMLRWLSWAWGVGTQGNPLLENHGIPSAAMLEVLFGAVGFDLTPGLESRASCPEAIWQAAKWWHDFYSKQERQAPVGAWCVDHRMDFP